MLKAGPKTGLGDRENITLQEAQGYSLRHLPPQMICHHSYGMAETTKEEGHCSKEWFLGAGDGCGRVRVTPYQAPSSPREGWGNAMARIK